MFKANLHNIVSVPYVLASFKVFQSTHANNYRCQGIAGFLTATNIQTVVTYTYTAIYIWYIYVFVCAGYACLPNRIRQFIRSR